MPHWKSSRTLLYNANRWIGHRSGANNMPNSIGGELFHKLMEPMRVKTFTPNPPMPTVGEPSTPILQSFDLSLAMPYAALDQYVRLTHTGLWTDLPPKRYVMDRHLRPGHSHVTSKSNFGPVNSTVDATGNVLNMSKCQTNYSYEFAGIPKFALYARMQNGKKMWMCAFKNGQYMQYVAIYATVTRNDIIHTRSRSIDLGSAWPVGQLPYGTHVCLVESFPGRGMRLARANGVSAVVLGSGSGVWNDPVRKGSVYDVPNRDDKLVPLLLPSKSVRMVDPACMATVGSVDGHLSHFRRFASQVRKSMESNKAMKTYYLRWALRPVGFWRRDHAVTLYKGYKWVQQPMYHRKFQRLKRIGKLNLKYMFH